MILLPDQSNVLTGSHGVPTFIDISPTSLPPLHSYSPMLSESQISPLNQCKHFHVRNTYRILPQAKRYWDVIHVFSGYCLYFTEPSAWLPCSTSKKWRLELSLCSGLPNKFFSLESFLWTITFFHDGGHSGQYDFLERLLLIISTVFWTCPKKRNGKRTMIIRLWLDLKVVYWKVWWMLFWKVVAFWKNLCKTCQVILFSTNPGQMAEVAVPGIPEAWGEVVVGTVCQLRKDLTGRMWDLCGGWVHKSSWHCNVSNLYLDCVNLCWEEIRLLEILYLPFPPLSVPTYL